MNDDFSLPRVRIIGFAGPSTLSDPSASAAALRRELEKLKSPGTELLAVSPLASETDLIFGREAIGQGIPLVLLLSVPADQLAGSFPGPSGIEFDIVLKKAARIEVLPPAPFGTPMHLGQRLVDKVDVLLAILDGKKSTGADDTAEIVTYARNRGRTVVCLQQDSEKIEVDEAKAENDSPAPVVSMEALQKMLGDPPPKPNIPGKLLLYFTSCDAQATRTAPQVRRYVVNIVLANAVASIAGSASSSFPHSAAIGTFLTVMKFGCIFLGLGIFAMLRHRQSQNRWLEYRLKAEVCRSAIATWYSRHLIEPLSVDEIPELRELIRALHYFRATEPPPNEISLEGFKADYGTRRVVDQHLYFQAQARKATEVSGKLTPVYWYLSGAALIASAASLFFQSLSQRHDALGTWTNFVFFFIPTVAPALASWILAWEAIEAVGRKKARFSEMARLMQAALVDLVHSHSWEAVHDVVKRTEKLLLHEVLEWYSFVKYK